MQASCHSACYERGVFASALKRLTCAASLPPTGVAPSDDGMPASSRKWLGLRLPLLPASSQPHASVPRPEPVTLGAMALMVAIEDEGSTEAELRGLWAGLRGRLKRPLPSLIAISRADLGR